MRGPALRSDANTDCATSDTRLSVPYHPYPSQAAPKNDAFQASAASAKPVQTEVVQALPSVTVETSSRGNKAFVMVLMGLVAIAMIVATIVICSL
ncbi:MAG: hypothetical protein KBC69_01950 [Candidatus Magasanikbacteria bacterium]|nr:hypothetical protein [Candidatus Magasanikbacteria bacterium]